MEHTYWLERKHASLRLARGAACSEARLIHYDLAGRYSLKASFVAPQHGRDIASVRRARIAHSHRKNAHDA